MSRKFLSASANLFKPDTGFWLNGKNFKLKGVCLHDDGGAFGAAVPMGVWQERLKAPQEIGVNAIRCGAQSA